MEQSREVIIKLHSSLAELSPKLGSILLGLSSSQFTWRPSLEGGRASPWSIAECVEHLTVTARLYLTQLRKMDLEASGANSGPMTRIADRLTAWLIINVAPNSKIRLPAPRNFRPSRLSSVISSGRAEEIAISDVLSDFVSVHEQLAKFILELHSDAQLQGLRVRSPVSSLISLQLKQCFQIIIAHAHRHLEQIERVKGNTDFPRV